MSIENLPPELIDKYEVHEYRHAIAILNVDFPEEYNEVVEMLSAFTLKKCNNRSWRAKKSYFRST